MSVITISRGSFSGGKILAECLARRLGYRSIDRDIIVERAAAYGVSQYELRDALEKPPNTSNFAAPTTTTRDLDAAAWLSDLAMLPADFAQRLREAKADFASRSSDELLLTNYKLFQSTPRVTLGISQLEAAGSSQLLSRPDFVDSVARLSQLGDANLVFATLVDLAQAKTYIVAPDADTRRILSSALTLSFDGVVAVCPRILLRKSDIVPPLNEYFRRLR
jgi:inorganic pyrophosphatase/exopolyphosphatase